MLNECTKFSPRPCASVLLCSVLQMMNASICCCYCGGSRALKHGMPPAHGLGADTGRYVYLRSAGGELRPTPLPPPPKETKGVTPSAHEDKHRPRDTCEGNTAVRRGPKPSGHVWTARRSESSSSSPSSCKSPTSVNVRTFLATVNKTLSEHLVNFCSLFL